MEESKMYINENGDKIWYLPSEGNWHYHRLDGPAIEFANGLKWWYVNGKPHCLNRPAIERADGTKVWYINGELHRLDGPAIEYADGSKEWWFNGKLLPIKEVEDWIKENKIDLKTVEGQMAFKLRWT